MHYVSGIVLVTLILLQQEPMRTTKVTRTRETIYPATEIPCNHVSAHYAGVIENFNW